MEYLHLAHTLADAFNALADEVQTLTDRKTVLEHKLRFAHEQFQYLADKYAPAAPEIADTLAKLQIPPYNPLDNSLPVPLPRSYNPGSQHQIALVIRDGRRVANQIASLGDASKTTGSSREASSQASDVATSMSTALEQDFTVQGKKGHLQCPFSKPATASGSGDQDEGVQDTTPHHSMDPICAAMYAESTSQQARTNGSSTGKCPIRYMDKHSPAEIAHYVETHKHELPRSHEICLRRYQRDEDQIKKIDSKYGDIVSMIEGLGQLHQPMLPEAEDDPTRPSDVAQPSNERVENWAQAVSVNSDPNDAREPIQEDGDRQGHFDRPFREVRVGESPSRPWGISVPPYDPSTQDDNHPLSPPPAPVRMPSPIPSVRSARTPTKNTPGKCPFDHTKFAALGGMPPSIKHDPPVSVTLEDAEPSRSFSPVKETAPPPEPTTPPQPAFINPDMTKGTSNLPQMIFTGPVFIGYPMDQAIQFMNQYRGSQ
ncbi:hypothetical protein NW754_006486 [Fusarium falciforme]|uniref:Uncharacterized protein n=1 Tax=Fusarium falciforme TaxID=195108 RepID=A0A9W8V8A6_9HYPO|nr:hypothetical protein NW754_006486 [Fusarium falciforme]KAJ4197838.1 hypothetical protein NW755_000536 [Fusarium falciforme]KAJ4209002.1 hypothetical protein NW767_000911 [Fusarium falciforme]KAJ4262312.1 hypothetical protein NW757_000571 [Fusarium falciforme]